MKAVAVDPQEQALQARIVEAARWHRCYRCHHAPCTCPEGEGLGRVLADGAALATGKPRRLRQDPEQVMPGNFKPAPKRRGGGRR